MVGTISIQYNNNIYQTQLSTSNRSSEPRGALLPLGYRPDDVLHLRVAGVPQHALDVFEELPALLALHDVLEDPDASPPLAVPVIRVRVQPLKNVKGLCGKVVGAGRVALVGDQLKLKESSLDSTLK